MKSQRCAKCGAESEIGFLVDRSRHDGVAHWADGEPRYLFLSFLRMRARRKLPIRSWRCRKCGYLESFAVEPAGSASRTTSG